MNLLTECICRVQILTLRHVFKFEVIWLSFHSVTTGKNGGHGAVEVKRYCSSWATAKPRPWEFELYSDSVVPSVYYVHVNVFNTK